jgi:16S rRNA (guanine1207-N2)-methyltransferase
LPGNGEQLLFTANIKGINLSFKTDKSLFSPDHPDKGTLNMIDNIKLSSDEKVLDLGCGYGIVGIYIAKIIGPQNVFLSDIDPAAVELAKENAAINGVPEITAIQSSGFENLNEKDFSMILTNPPYHSDFSVAKHFIEKGFNRLRVGGRMLMVTKRREWYEKKFTAIFGGVKIHEQDGYFVFEAIKKSMTRSDKVK